MPELTIKQLTLYDSLKHKKCKKEADSFFEIIILLNKAKIVNIDPSTVGPADCFIMGFSASLLFVLLL